MIEFNEKRVEEVARHYCRLKGLDPDAKATDRIFIKDGVFTTEPVLNWELATERVREWLTMEAAIWESPTETVPPKSE